MESFRSCERLYMLFCLEWETNEAKVRETGEVRQNDLHILKRTQTFPHASPQDELETSNIERETLSSLFYFFNYVHIIFEILMKKWAMNIRWQTTTEKICFLI